jgi:hypothetical protein
MFTWGAKCYHGTGILDAEMVRRDPGSISDEVIIYLVGATWIIGAGGPIEAEIPGDAPENVVRTVTESTRTLKFECNSGFEND